MIYYLQIVAQNLMKKIIMLNTNIYSISTKV